jgi:hypothetical protein
VKVGISVTGANVSKAPVTGAVSLINDVATGKLDTGISVMGIIVVTIDVVILEGASESIIVAEGTTVVTEGTMVGNVVVTGADVTSIAFFLLFVTGATGEPNRDDAGAGDVVVVVVIVGYVFTPFVDIVVVVDVVVVVVAVVADCTAGIVIVVVADESTFVVIVCATEEDVTIMITMHVALYNILIIIIFQFCC